MRPCPNCGQSVASDSDRFCPNCGAVLPPVSADAGSQPSQPAYQPAGQPSAQPPYQPVAQPSPQPTYTAPAPDPNAYSAPAYTRNTVSGSNLPVAGVQRNPPPVTPARGTNTWMNMVRSVVSMELRGLLILAAVVVVVIIAAVLIFKIVAWFLGLWWLWLLIIAAIAYTSQRRRRRGRRLP